MSWQIGITDANGAFTYAPGETVTFSMGDVLLGQGTAKSTMTPVDLVPGATDESHPVVTNMARMLQTADNDDDPANGIMITSAVSDWEQYTGKNRTKKQCLGPLIAVILFNDP